MNIILYYFVLLFHVRKYFTTRAQDQYKIKELDLFYLFWQLTFSAHCSCHSVVKVLFFSEDTDVFVITSNRRTFFFPETEYLNFGALDSQRRPSCPYKTLCFQTLRHPWFLSNFQSPKFKFSVSGKKNVRLFVFSEKKPYL